MSQGNKDQKQGNKDKNQEPEDTAETKNNDKRERGKRRPGATEADIKKHLPKDDKDKGGKGGIMS